MRRTAWATWTASAAVALALGCAGCDTELGGQDATTADSGGSGSGVDPNDIPDEQLAISGKVLDANTLVPIAGATITTTPDIGEAETGSAGTYALFGDQGTAIQIGTQYSVTASHPGYTPNVNHVTVKPGHNRHVDILLSQ